MLAVHDYFLFNPLNLTLPRKFKIALEGCPIDCAQATINDIGLYARTEGGKRGFSVWVGGGLGAAPFLAVHVLDFVPEDDVLIACEAIVHPAPLGRAEESLQGAAQVPCEEARDSAAPRDGRREMARVDRERGAAPARPPRVAVPVPLARARPSGRSDPSARGFAGGSGRTPHRGDRKATPRPP
jgi:hypothetical protein